jgi:conjugative transposon TraK protein
MMLQSLNNLDKNYKQNRILTIISLLGMVVTAIFSVTYVTNAIMKQSQVVYALMGDNAVSLRAVSVLDNRPVEAYNHIDLFHRKFYDLDPDREVIDANLDYALGLGDNSIRDLYLAYEEDNYYRGLVSSNTSQDVILDSISLDMSSYPYYFRYTGQVKITRRSSIATRSLITEGYFRDVQRSKNNPHGFLIENYHVVENKDLMVERRYD